MKLSTKRWRLLGTVVAVAVTTTAGGVAWAATNADPTPSPSPSASPSVPSQKPGQGNQQGPGKGFGHRGEFGFGGALHGEFVVPKNGGGYQTIAMQQGKVTAVSQDSITVKSDDGYSRTYAVVAETLVNSARDGISSIKTGNTVSVSAVVANNTATATTINDGTAHDAAGQKWGFRGGPR